MLLAAVITSSARKIKMLPWWRDSFGFTRVLVQTGVELLTYLEFFARWSHTKEQQGWMENVKSWTWFGEEG